MVAGGRRWSPVVYVWMPDGTLHGTWDGGLALEKLTPG
ncbi:hypothetical protein AIOL_004551 [Candidatus Rhodobacter oscarellae]|uniref:Uncharacterized protein n=1 Tax=Candidatus Rhodobacter oscarellae TaxID=1675527 RepID=A0A0J9ECV4_9RHOB|nr:hypothetical protein AIOL_004551 [Candidatus Rhodobacter lobularis]